MPKGLKRIHGFGHLHFITFSCYRRLPLLGSARSRNTFVETLEQSGTLADISHGGCYVEMSPPLPLQTPIELSFNVGETPLRVSGEVRSSQPAMGLGVSFTGMSPDNFEALRRFAPPVTLPAPLSIVQPRMSGQRAPSGPHSEAQANSISLPATEETLEAVVRLLLRKGLLTRSDLTEEMEKLKSVRR
jgi:hypothetical protein